MSERDLPNGMRLGQHVRVYGAQGRRAGVVLAEGEVVGYYDRPTVVLRTPGGERTVVAGFDWDDTDEDVVRVSGRDKAIAALRAVRPGGEEGS